MLTEISSDGPRLMFNLCVAGETHFQNLEINASFKAHTGKTDQGGDPVGRYQNANNYYIARMNPLEDNFHVYKVENGKRSQLASSDFQSPAGEWQKIRIIRKGDSIQH